MKTRLFIILIASLAILSGCDYNYVFSQWECSTGDVYNITGNSATLEGYVDCDEWYNKSVKYRSYFCYYTKADLSDAITVEAENWGRLIRQDISNLQRNKIYYFYAFITTYNGVDTIKGDTRFFTTRNW